MKTYLENLITEKGQDLENDVINIPGHFGITFEVLIEYIVNAKQYHKQIRNTLVMIDFKNGDVFHYLKHLANGMVKQYNLTHEIVKFEKNQTYIMSWIGDSELKTPYTVIKRTAKMITVQCRNETKTTLCKITIYEGVEQISPTGKYSMSPVLTADKVQKIETDKSILNAVKNLAKVKQMHIVSKNNTCLQNEKSQAYIDNATNKITEMIKIPVVKKDHSILSCYGIK